VFQLALPPQWRIHNVFHASLLTPYKETEEHGENFAQPPPELIEGHKEFEVEQILNSRHVGRAKKLQYLLQWKGYSHTHDSWQDATEVHTPVLVKEYYNRKQTAVHKTTIKGTTELPKAIPSISHICTSNMSNGSSSPASTFSFQYPVMDNKETPTARTTNDHQYDDQVVLFGAGAGQQSVRTDPSLTDFNPLGVDITLCNTWFKLEAMYYNNTWWEAFQDDRSEVSKSGGTDVPGQPHTPINWAGPESPFFVPTHASYLPDPRDAIKPTISLTPPHTLPPIGLTATTPAAISTQGTVPTATTCASAATNNGHHVDHAIWACDEACHYNHTHDGYT
jgi:Chromo (CHRromatin Organisation MOdifier) domain